MEFVFTHYRINVFVYDLVRVIMVKYRFILFMFFIAFFFADAVVMSQKHKKKVPVKSTIQIAENLIKNSKDPLHKLDLIASKQRERKRIIERLDREYEILSIIIKRHDKNRLDLVNEIEKEKSEYKILINLAFKYKRSTDPLLFILSSDNFNRAFLRLNYIKRLSHLRKKKISFIHKRKEIIEKTIVELNKLQEQQKSTLGLLKGEIVNVKKDSVELSSQKKVVESLKTDSIVKVDYEIDNQGNLVDRISLEILKAFDDGRNSAVSAFVDSSYYVREYLIDSEKGNLRWPVENGIITTEYGVRSHPYVSNTFINSHGVQISTEKSENVYAVWNGKVAKIIELPGGINAVILRHGDYYSLYSNIVDVLVVIGQEVHLSDKIGRISYNEKIGNYVLNFQIWKKDVSVNPEEWLINNSYD